MITLNKIYKGDCIEIIRSIEEESVDLIICDPPYNLGKDFGNESDKWDSIDEWLDWCKLWLDECKRVLKHSGSLFVYGSHHYICYLQCYLYEIELLYKRVLIWHYENGKSQHTKAPCVTYEPILWFTKTNNYTYHIIREPYKSTERLKHKITKNGKVWTPNPEGKRGGDVWKIPTLAGRRFRDEKVDHPTQKPLALCDKIINHFSNKHDIVLIPFAGSGSECVSAKNNNRSYIGVEINPNYISIAIDRLAQNQQANLF
tara:strand:+ start:56 stop:829 length:774 start_codon:yes stop_codon:yes gene_type:complete